MRPVSRREVSLYLTPWEAERLRRFVRSQGLPSRRDAINRCLVNEAARLLDALNNDPAHPRRGMRLALESLLRRAAGEAPTVERRGAPIRTRRAKATARRVIVHAALGPLEEELLDAVAFIYGFRTQSQALRHAVNAELDHLKHHRAGTERPKRC